MKYSLQLTTLVVSVYCAFFGSAFSHGGGGGRTMNTETLEQGLGTISLDYTVTRFETFSNQKIESSAEQGLFLESLKSQFSYTSTISYGVIDNLTISISQSWVRQSNIKAGELNGASGVVDFEGHSSGWGDFEIMSKYQLFYTDEYAMSAIAGVKLPTGENDEKNRIGIRLEQAHQPGSGSVDYLYGVAFSKHIDHMNIGASFVHKATGKGSQKSELGDSYTTGIFVNNHLFSHFHGGLELVHVKRNRDNERGGINPNSGGDQLYLVPTINYEGLKNMVISTSLSDVIWERLRGEQESESWSWVIGVEVRF